MSIELPEADFTSIPWARDYGTSCMDPERWDVLRKFYVPALLRSVAYDRVTGYFRSSGLAAASRGYTALLERGGTARLIAGCDLAATDVQTILDGNTKRLEDSLIAELESASNAPEEIRNGVELLAHMVKAGCLEVRVGFRRHQTTGVPIQIDSIEDGYMHEKWGILTDKHGQQLSFHGSINESKAALQHNAESITCNMGWSNQADRESVANRCQSFDAMWNNTHPAFVVKPLPDAVREKLITIADRVQLPVEVDGKPAVEETHKGPSPEEWLRFAIVKHAPKMAGGETVGLYTAPVEPWPHQEIVARRLLDTYPNGYLLCDEVGLGKTIECGLAFRALWLSGRAKRILIAPPASLISQWLSEMTEKFLMPFGIARSRGTGAQVSYLLPDKHEENRPSLFDRDLVIVSTGLIQRPERMQQLGAALSFDITLVDEAHFARRQNARVGLDEEPRFGKLYRALEQTVKPHTEALWLATATPMQISAVEAYDLADLVGRLGCFASEQSLVGSYYSMIGGMMRRHSPTAEEQETLKIIANRTQWEDPDLWRRVEEWLLNKDPQLNVTATRWLEQGLWPSNADDERGLLRLLFMISPLHRVMMRHTRGLLEQYRKHNLLTHNLATRRVRPIPEDLKFRSDERSAYEDLERFCTDLQLEIGSNLNTQQRSSLGFFLSLLQQRMASSAVAICKTMERRRERVIETIAALDRYGLDSTDELEELRDDTTRDEWETDEAELEALIKLTLRGRTRADLVWESERLREMLPTYQTLADIRPTKTDVLLRTMAGRRNPSDASRYRQTVVFTRYTDTLHHLVDTFKAQAPDMRIGTFSGEGGTYWDVDNRRWVNLEKNRDAIKHRFLQGDIDLLLCTDAAAEGLNLQSADLLINYDLPWNPMKLEQRIGRIDRIGQKHNHIEVLNLATIGSVEQIIYGRLWTRLQETAAVVGSQQFSLLPLDETDFRDLAGGTITPDELESKALAAMKLHEKQIQQLEIPAEDLYHIFNQELRSFSAEERPLTLGNIEHALFESDYLKAKGTVSHDAPLGQWLEVKEQTGWGGSLAKVAMTTSRALYDEGVRDSNYPLKFASYGEPYFDEIVGDMTDPAYQPESVAIVTASRDVSGLEWQRVGILAATQDAAGKRKLVKIYSYRDAIELTLDPTGTVSDADVAAYKVELEQELVLEERSHRDRQRMIVRHQQIGDANRAFMYLLAIGMLRSARRSPIIRDSDSITQVINVARDHADEDRMIILDIDAERLSPSHRTDLIVDLANEHQPGQWRSTPHFRQAAMHIISREKKTVQRGRTDAATTNLISHLARRAEGLLSK